MNAEMVPISVARLKALVQDWPEANTITTAATLADPLFAVMMGDVVLAFVAFIPMTVMSDVAYAWLQLAPAAVHNKHAIARVAKRWLPTVHTRYPKLVGHCIGDPPSMAWLGSLGARFGARENGLIRFTIEANNG